MCDTTSWTLFDRSWVALRENCNLLSIDNKFSFFLFNSSIESTMGGIVFEHVNHVVKINKWIIDSDNVDVITSSTDSGDQTKPKYY